MIGDGLRDRFSMSVSKSGDVADCTVGGVSGGKSEVGCWPFGLKSWLRFKIQI